MTSQNINPGGPVFNMGKLRSDIEMTLHTFHAARLWSGRKPNTGDKHQGVLGLTGFVHITSRITRASAEDDPYADWMLIQIEERLEKGKVRIAEIRDEIKTILAKIPRQLNISENLNMSPARIPLYVNTPLGFQGAYLLIEFDEMVRDLLLAQHVGLIGRENKEVLINQGAHQVRSLFALTQNYRYTGCSRDDIAANNAKARETIEKYGLPPQDITEGIRRSKYSLQIRKPNDPINEDQDVEAMELVSDDAPAVEEAETQVAVPVVEDTPVKKSRKKAANV